MRCVVNKLFNHLFSKREKWRQKEIEMEDDPDSPVTYSQVVIHTTIRSSAMLTRA